MDKGVLKGFCFVEFIKEKGGFDWKLLKLLLLLLLEELFYWGFLFCYYEEFSYVVWVFFLIYSWF